MYFNDFLWFIYCKVKLYFYFEIMDIFEKYLKEKVRLNDFLLIRILFFFKFV